MQFADLEMVEHGESAITICRLKTNQEGIGQVCYLAPDTMCHVAARLANAGHAEGTLFRNVGKAGGPLDLRIPMHSSHSYRSNPQPF